MAFLRIFLKQKHVSEIRIIKRKIKTQGFYTQTFYYQVGNKHQFSNKNVLILRFTYRFDYYLQNVFSIRSFNDFIAS